MRASKMISRQVLTAFACWPLFATPAHAQINASVPAGFTVAAVGDMIQTRPIVPTMQGQSPGLLKILQGADVTFGNYETTALDFATFDAAAILPFITGRSGAVNLGTGVWPDTAIDIGRWPDVLRERGTPRAREGFPRLR